MLEIDGMRAGKAGEREYLRAASPPCREEYRLGAQGFVFGSCRFYKSAQFPDLLVVEPLYVRNCIMLFVGLLGVV